MKAETVHANPKGCWRICIVTAVVIFCTVGLNITAFSIYIPYLTELLQLSYTQSSNFLVVRSLFAFISLFIVKQYYEKVDLKIGFSLTMILAAAGFFLYASAKNFPMLCVATAISGLAYGLGGMYPAAILIHRWFIKHEGLAIGICAASTGVAGIVASPILTILAEQFSVRSALRFEAIFLLVCTCVCSVLIRNYPPNVVPQKVTRQTVKAPRLKFNFIFLALMAIGALGGPGYSYVAMHYTTEGIDPYRVSILVSVMGIALVVGKFILGELLDLQGARRAHRLFFIAALFGCGILGIGGTSFLPALLAVILFGFGNALGTVALSTYAKDMSTPETYTATQQQYQMVYLFGGLIGSPLPGWIATASHNYKGFFLLIGATVLAAFIILQNRYAMLRKNDQNAT